MLSQLIFILILRMSSQEDGMELKDKELLKRLSIQLIEYMVWKLIRISIQLIIDVEELVCKSMGPFS